MKPPSKKKIPYPVDSHLHTYLKAYARETPLLIDYETLRRFTDSYPLMDKYGRDSLWLSVGYPRGELKEISVGLRHIYALLRASGDMSVMEHLFVDRIDFCEFGNSQPFRVRIVNRYNDNQDYFYVKKADASRVYGLELEHLLAPNRMHFFVHNDTLVEEHVVGIPGDQFMRHHLQDPGFKEVRIAKEFVKFNERCFIRLLGDMRSYNFVVDATPDFEEVQYRIRPLDFDQQCYDGRPSFYRPQYFKENNPLIHFGIKHMEVTSMRQYQREERSAFALRMKTEEERLSDLLDTMEKQPLAPWDKIVQLRTGLAEHYHEAKFLGCDTMGAILRQSLQMVHIGTSADDLDL
jgi:hypothetical protein